MDSDPVQFAMTAQPDSAPDGAAFHQTTFGTALLLLVFIYFQYYPGLMNADSIDMLNQALTGHYHDWHSVSFPVVWSILNRIYVGPALLLLLLQTLFVSALYIQVSNAFRKVRTQVAAMLIVLLYPPIFNAIGMVTKDFAFLGTMFLVAALAMWLPNVSRRRRWIVLAVLALSVVVAVSLRIDGMIPLVPLAGVCLYGSMQDRLTRRGWKFRFMVPAALALVFIFAAIETVNVFNHGIIQATPRYSFQPILIDDLVGISVKESQNLLPPYIVGRGVTLEMLQQRYSPQDLNTVLFGGNGPSIPLTSSREEISTLLKQWVSTVVKYPRSYLANRWDTFEYFLGIKPVNRWVLVQTNETRTFGLFPDFISIHAEYRVSPFVEMVMGLYQPADVLLRGWIYVLALFLYIPLYVMLWKIGVAKAGLLVAGALLAGIVAYLGMYFLLASGATIRYLQWPILVVLLLYLCPLLRGLEQVCQSALGSRNS